MSTVKPHDIVAATVSHLRVPFAAAISDSTHDISVMDVIALELRDAAGTEGLSYALGFDYATDVLVAMIADAARYAVGTSPAERSATWRHGWQRYEYVGREGIATWGLAAVDIALWDLYGRQLSQPVWALLGGAQRQLPVYGSGGWLSYSETDLVAEASAYLADGYGGYKMKVGRDVDSDVRRVRKVRAELGDHVPLMIDANQGYGYADAKRLADAVAELDITWFEEPMHAARVQDYCRLREACAIPIAGGERAYLPQGIAEFLDADALDVVMPDILRIGGVAKWMDVAAMAGARDLAVAPHFYREFDVALAAATSHASFVESFRWTDTLFGWSATIAGGLITPSDEPGFGLRLREDARQSYTATVREITNQQL
jgi:L-alanine-DL-glutamate epimerase-like enolase superfamily enzyme